MYYRELKKWVKQELPKYGKKYVKKDKKDSYDGFLKIYDNTVIGCIEIEKIDEETGKLKEIETPNVDDLKPEEVKEILSKKILMPETKTYQ